MTPQDARDAFDRVQARITYQQLADDAEYARRALDRLRERVWESQPDPEHRFRRINVDTGPACTGWEREVLERQVLNFVLDNGFFPSVEYVKKMKQHARVFKREMPNKAQLNMAFKAVAA